MLSLLRSLSSWMMRNERGRVSSAISLSGIFFLLGGIEDGPCAPMAFLSQREILVGDDVCL